jgi:hypothetical protein
MPSAREREDSATEMKTALYIGWANQQLSEAAASVPWRNVASIRAEELPKVAPEHLNKVRVQRCGKSVTSKVERLWLGKPR